MLDLHPGTRTAATAARLPILALALTLAACRAPAPKPPAAHPVLVGPHGPAKPQFVFSGWGAAKALIRGGQVVQLVSGRTGGYSLVLQDRTWVHLVAKPGDPLPGNPMEYINKNAPNAKDIRHTVE